MKKLLLFGCSFFAAFSFSQTTIYQENFESGNTFTLNTSDLGAATTFNTWLMNNTYAGGSGTLICLGFPFSFTVANTPSQPVGITNAPSSNYMHISAQAAVASGITCASYIPSDGTCVSNESNFAKMTASISTLGFTGVTFDFWWMCAGSANAFGEVYYSLNNGSTWILKQSNLNNVTNWSQTSISDPAWDNQATLMFAFRFVNTTASTAADPAFAVDELIVTGMTATNAITTNPYSLAGWCFGSAQNTAISFDATGTYNPGNVFTAQLSDASGSFAAPTNIGSITSSASGPQTLIPFIPGTIPVGTGYRIRVVASSPATIGSDNGSDLQVYPLPTVTLSPLADVCLFGPTVILSGGSPTGGTYSGQNVQNNLFFPNTVGTSDIFYSFQDANGCSNNTSQPITVNPTPTVTANPPTSVFCSTDGSFTMTFGTPSGGTYAGTGVTTNVFSPTIAGVGTHSLVYSYTDGNGCSSTALFDLIVDDCSSLLENSLIGLSIFPNPSADVITISAGVELSSIVLVDVNGRIVKIIDKQGVVDVRELKTGVYFVQVEYLGQRFTDRLIVQ
jgi:hypothetical protein